MGSEHGVAVIAEGISEKLDPEELASMPGVEMVYDPYGHIRLGEIPLTTILKRQVQDHFSARDDKLSIVDVTLGYELRCAQAIPYDVDYTRTLGYGAVRFLLSEPADGRTRHAGFICVEGGHLKVLPFNDLRDPTTGRIRIRTVDVRSEHYHVARKYMIRLEQSDLDDTQMCAKLAAAARMTPEMFLSAYGPAVTAPEGWSP
jgi:ATP-dependent phosphofructokinase / diphosphate-dependent phosphofructokinase